MRVLIVDDDDADALMISEALLESGLPTEVDRVADGREALDYLRRTGVHTAARRPHLILLDLNMPRMDGRQTLAEVKSDPALQTIPVVVLTTSGAVPDVLASYQYKANAYVTKPLNLDDFEAAVRRIKRFFSETALLPAEPPAA